MWGQHLIVDMGDCTRSAVTSEPTIRAFCRDLVDRIGMTAFGEPIVEHFANNDPAASGYSLVQLIETSSITAHFAEATGDVYLDVFSCRTFSEADVFDVCRTYFAPRTMNHTNLGRQAGHSPRLLSSAA